MVLTEAKKNKAPVFNRHKMRDVLNKSGKAIYLSSLTAFVLWCVFGLEVGVFNFLAVKVIVIPLALVSISLWGEFLWSKKHRDSDLSVILNLLTIIGFILISSVSGAIHCEVEEGQVQKEIAQQYGTKNHVDDVIVSKVKSYDTNRGKMLVYKVTSPDLEKGEYVTAYGHGTTIDSWKSISKEQFKALK